MDNITRQNFKAMSDGLKEQRAKTSELQETITTYNQIVGQLQNQVQQLQADLGFLKAKLQGFGRTT